MSFYYPQFQYTTPYLHPFYQPVQITPYVPAATLPPSPRPAQRVRFADDYETKLPQRQRRPSWHAGMAGMSPAPNPQPFPSPTMSYTPLPPITPWPAQSPFIHHRTRSDGALPQPAWISFPTLLAPAPALFAPSPFMYANAPLYQNPAPAPAPVNQLHPLLNGENAQGPLLFFDLSLSTFNPLRISAPGQTKGTPLSLAELEQPATHPGRTRMTITCDAIPQWPIVLEPQNTHERRSPYLSVQPEQTVPITLGDVLVAIHRSLQIQIRHVDWVRLSQAEEVAISRAYTRRCRTFPSVQAFEASQGVRRVDYLQERYIFKGLMRTSGDGYENTKLLVGPP